MPAALLGRGGIDLLVRGAAGAPPGSALADAIARRYAAGTLLGAWQQTVTHAPGERHMGIATLVTWLLTVGIGAYMLRTWIARGGPRMQSAGGCRLHHDSRMRRASAAS